MLSKSLIVLGICIVLCVICCLAMYATKLYSRAEDLATVALDIMLKITGFAILCVMICFIFG